MADVLEFVVSLTDDMSGAAKSASEGALGLASSLLKVGAAVAVTVAGLVAAGAAFALVAADEKQSLQLTLGALLQNEQAGIQLEEQIDALSKTLPISEGAVDEFAISLVNAGLRGDQLIDTVKSLGTVSAAVGAGGAGKLQNIIERWNAAGKVEPINPKQLAGTGVTIDALNSVIAAKLGTTVENVKGLLKAGKVSTETGIDALNDVIKNKLGDVAAKKMLGFGAQAQLVKKNIGNLFEDALGTGGLESFQKGMADVLSLFDDANGSGKTLKFLLGELFTPLFKGVTALLPVAKEAFIQLEIGALRIYLALRSAKDKVKEFFDTITENKSAEYLEIFRMALGGVLDEVLGIVNAIGIFAGVVGSSFGFAYDIVMGFWGAVKSVWATLSGLAADALKIGTDLVTGFINGIQAGTTRVVDSVKNLGTSALDALGISLDAHSPSRKAFDFGVDTGEGYSLGVDASNDNAQSSLASLGQLPTAAVAPAGRGGGGGPVSVSIEMNFSGSVSKADAEEIGNQVLAKVAGYFDSMANQTGAPVTEGAAA